MATNKAAYLDKQGARLEVRDAPMPKPGPDEVVIQNKAVAVNPVDWKMQDWGLFVKSYPTVLGTDVSGDIAEVGDNVKNFKKGARVLAYDPDLYPNSDGIQADAIQPFKLTHERQPSSKWL